MRRIIATGATVKKIDDASQPVKHCEWGLVVCAYIDDTPEGKKLYYKVMWNSFHEEICDADEIIER